MISWPSLRLSVDWNRCDKCCHDLIWSVMWFGNDETGRIHDQLDVICGLEQMI
jgi:hypothetical protein